MTKTVPVRSVSRPRLSGVAVLFLVTLVAGSVYQLTNSEASDAPQRRPMPTAADAIRADYEARRAEARRQHDAAVESGSRTPSTETPSNDVPITEPVRPLLPLCGETITYDQGLALGRRLVPDLQCWSRMTADDVHYICYYAGRRPELQSNGLYTTLCAGSSTSSSGHRSHHGRHSDGSPRHHSHRHHDER